MVTMLMLGIMTVITACGSSNKNDVVSSNTETDADSNIDTSKKTTKHDKTEVVSVDDVHFDSRDLAMYGGSTYDIKEERSCTTPSASFKTFSNMTYEIAELDNHLTHMIESNQKYMRDETVIDSSYDAYYNDEDNIMYILDSTTTTPQKYTPTNRQFGSDYLAKSWEKIFDLPWTLKSETDDEFIFGLENDTDFSDITELNVMIVDEDDEVSNLVASYTFDKNNSILTSIELSFDIDHVDRAGEKSLNHYSFELTSRNLGNTKVEIPEDIINNAVEKEFGK